MLTSFPIACGRTLLCRPPREPEEVARGRALYRTYVKLLWKRHIVQSRDLNRKLRLKWAAIAALPTPELRQEALVVDARIPLRLRVATITPPLHGFHVPSKVAVAPDDEAGVKGGATGASASASVLSTLASRRRGAQSGGPSLLATMRSGRLAATDEGAPASSAGQTKSRVPSAVSSRVPSSS